MKKSGNVKRLITVLILLVLSTVVSKVSIAEQVGGAQVSGAQVSGAQVTFGLTLADPGEQSFANQEEAEKFDKCFKKNMNELRGQPLEILKEAFVKYQEGRYRGKFFQWLLGYNVGWGSNQLYKLLMLTRDREDVVPESWQNIVKSYNDIMSRCKPGNSGPFTGQQVSGQQVHGSGQVSGKQVHGSGQ